MKLNDHLLSGKFIPSSNLVALSYGQHVLQIFDLADSERSFHEPCTNSKLMKDNHAADQTMQMISCTPSGSTILTAVPNECAVVLSVWDRSPDNNYVRRTDKGKMDGSFRCCAISPDSTKAIYSDNDRFCAVDLSTMTLLSPHILFIRDYERSHEWAASKGSYCGYSPCGTISVLADSFGRVWVCGGQDDPLARPVAVKKVGSKAAHLAEVTSCCFGPELKLVTGGLDNVARVWNLNIAEIKRLSSSGKAFIDQDKDVALGCELALVLSGHRAAINEVCWSSDGAFITSASDDKSLRLWDAANGDPLVVLTFESPVRLCDFSPDSSKLLVGLKSRDVDTFNVSDLLNILNNDDFQIKSVFGSLTVTSCRKAKKSSGSQWSQEGAIMIVIAGGAGILDASVEEDGADATDSKKEVVKSGGKKGEGGGGFPFQGGYGGGGWKSGAKNLYPSKTQNGATLAPALSDPEGLFLGGFYKCYDGFPNRFGGLGGGGTGWYASGGGGGYSGGGGASTNGKSGGGGSFVASGIEGLKETKPRSVQNRGPGRFMIKTPAGEEIRISSDMGNQKEKFGFDLVEPIESMQLFFENSGVVVYEVKKTGTYQFSLHGAGNNNPDFGKGADLFFELSLKEGNSIGVLAGNRGSSSDMGGGASIVWLGAGLQETFINSLTASRAGSALRLLANGAQVDDAVVTALLNKNNDGDTKWALLLSDSSADSIALVKVLLEKTPDDRLKSAMSTAETLLTTVVVGKEEGAMRVLDLGTKLSSGTYGTFISEPIGVNRESRLAYLVRNERSWDLVRRLVKLHEGLADIALFESVRCRKYPLCELLLKDKVTLSGSFVDLLLKADKLEESVWALFFADINGTNGLVQSLVALSVDKLGTAAVLVLMDLNLFPSALELLKKWSIEVSSIRDRLFVVRGENSTLLHQKVQLEDSAELVHYLVLRDQSLIEVRDQDDRRVYDVALKVVRLKMDDATLFCGRFKVVSKSPEHLSSTSVVLRAIDVLEEDKAVVLKLMSRKDQFLKEIDSREMFEETSIDQFSIPVLLHSESPELKLRWEKEVAIKLGYNNYKHGIVMPAGDRNLLTIYLQERPSLNTIRGMFEDILLSVGCLHSLGIMHGDIKPLNFVRLSTDHKLRLIDFDAAVSFAEGSEMKFAGGKFSSGFLPPELLAKLNKEEATKFNLYWSTHCKDDALLEKVKPLKVGPAFYVVKTFLLDDKGSPISVDNLPYQLEKADESVDVWALGVLFYQLLVGEPLIPLSRDDDFVNGTNASVVCSWTKKAAQLKLRNIKDNLARDLVGKMLHPYPEDRPSVVDLLEHPFFTMNKVGDAELAEKMEKLTAMVESIEHKQDDIIHLLNKLDERTKSIEGITLKTRAELGKGVGELKKRISSASDVTIPTIFVICPAADEASFKEEVQELMKGLKEKNLEKVGEKSTSLFNKASALYSTISDAVANPMEAMKSKFKELLGDTDYEMFLVCQICYEKQASEEPDGLWPVKISRSSDRKIEMAAKILPLAKASLQVASMINTASGIGRLLGYPIPTIPVDKIDLSYLENSSSVTNYEKLEERLFEFDEEQEKEKGKKKEPMKGYYMREYQRFLDEYDANQDWGKLQRILLDDGIATWCCERCAQVVEAHPDSSLDELRAKALNDWEMIEEEEFKPETDKSSSLTIKKNAKIHPMDIGSDIDELNSRIIVAKDRLHDTEMEMVAHEKEETRDMFMSIQSALARVEAKIDSQLQPKSCFGFK